MGLLDKNNKRNFYPVEEFTDRKVHVRSMKYGEIKRMNALPKEQQTAFVMGVCLVDEAGSPEIPQQPEEKDADFSDRVAIALDNADVDTETISIISRAIGKIGRFDVEALAKN